MKGMPLYKLIFLLFFGVAHLHAALIGSNFDKRDIQILNELDIDPSFITDYELQQTYSRYSRSTDYYKQKLSDATLFVPMIKNILRNEGIPSSFIYLAMAESNFTLDAKSHVKAMGLWQFMPQTGKIFGLENNLYVDERMDFVKSTYAATKYLKRLHEKFGKWYLAAMAYNSGEGRVIEAITRATIDLYVEQNGSKAKKEEIAQYRQIISNYQSKKVRFRELYQVYKEVKTWGITPDIYTLLSVQNKTRRQYVPNETREYIRKIVALGMMNNKSFISNDDAHLLNMGNTTTSIATVKVKGGMHLQSVASAIGMDYKELAKLNLHIKEYIIPPFVEEYDIYIPYSTLSRFNLNKDQIKNDRFTIYQVKAGDSLASIGKKYKIAYSIIKDFNQLKSNILSVNQKLIVPILNEKNQRVTQQTVSSSKVKSYYVKNGDTLYSISQRYNIALEKLMKDNNLKNSSINIGDKLVFNY